MMRLEEAEAVEAGRIGAGALSLDGVSYHVGRKPLVENVSLTVAPGEMMGLLGPNGAGKSSLLRTIYRVNRPSAGVVRLGEKDIWRQPHSWAARNIGAVLQDIPSEFPLSVRDVVAMGRAAHKKLFEPDNAHDAALVGAAIELLDLAPLEMRAYRTLSGGERQRVLVARALVQQPQLLVLDEPTNHLDIHHQLQLLRFIRDLGITVIAALHDLNMAAMFCDRLCLLNRGRVRATGAPEEVLTESILAEVYRIDATIGSNPRTGTPLVMVS